MKLGEKQLELAATQRNLRALRGALRTLVVTVPFEKITVRMICESAAISRATFYNYFEDLNDFLSYSLDKPFRAITETDSTELSREQVAKILVLGFDYIDANAQKMEEMMRVNSGSNALLLWLKRELQARLLAAFREETVGRTLRCDPQLVAMLLTGVLSLLIETKLRDLSGLSREEALAFLSTAVNYEQLGLR